MTNRRFKVTKVYLNQISPKLHSSETYHTLVNAAIVTTTALPYSSLFLRAQPFSFNNDTLCKVTFSSSFIMSKYTFIHPIPVFQKCHPSSLIISKNRSSVCCTQQPISIPTTLSDTINLAAKSTQAAIEAGHKQICVTALPPGLNPVLEENFPFSLPALHTLASGLFTETPYLRNLPDTRILFSSAGGAAAFTASMDSKSPTATSYAIRDSTDNTFSPHANLLVSPITYRGDRVMDDLEAALAAQPDAIWVLLNPSLGVDRAVVGIKESSRRAAFRDMFFDAFYFRNLVCYSTR